MRLQYSRQLGCKVGSFAAGARLSGAGRRVNRSAPLSVRAVLETTVTQGSSEPSRPTEPSPHSYDDSFESPGESDRRRFEMHWSVDMWKTFYPRRWLESLTNDSSPVSDRLQDFAATLSSAVSSAGVFQDSETTRYWAYHLSRSSFFLVQGIAGLVASRLRDAQSSGDAPAGGTSFGRFEDVLRSGWAGPVGEALLTYYQDMEMIREGKYGMPWDMNFGHRQYNPFFVANKGLRFLREASDTLQRRDRGSPDTVWLKSAFLPPYFQNTFHYQTDGWLSSWSAGIYETSTETLFIGRQDAAQRTTLVHISDHISTRGDRTNLKVLEIGCGTGRFGTFLKDNYPNVELTLSDLSPFYLEEARKNLRYWKRVRAPNSTLGGVDGAGTTFLMAAGEDLASIEDESMDIVYSIYLFHELPTDVRKQVVREMSRVVKPGGLVVLTDSTQIGDRDALDATLGNFEAFNEPYYKDYINTDLGALFEEAGLTCGMKIVASTTKSLSFYKNPRGDDVESEG